MDYAQSLADMEAQQAKWQAWDREQAREQAEFEGKMQTLHLAIQMDSQRFSNAMAYLLLTPHPTPEVFGAILGVQSTGNPSPAAT